MARGSTSKTLVWILMALLILGLGGFGVTNLGGNLRSIGSVGDREIDVNRYARAIQEEIRAEEARLGQPVPFTVARALNLDKIALAKLIAATALDDEADRIGLSAGDANLRDALLQIQGFTGLDGKFDREAYSFYLDRTGQSEADFEQGLRDEMARGLLQRAVLAGLPENPAHADTLVNFLAERRDFTWAALGADDLAEPLPSPDEATLASYHQDNAAQFTLPERKRITYAWIVPDMILDQVNIDEARLKEHYDERRAEFEQPERRLVERLSFADQAAADAAMVALEAKSLRFEDLVAERGLELSDIDLGDVLEGDLGDAGAAVFAATTGDVVGPFTSDLGPALFRINGILAARSTSFEDARAQLREELALGIARRQIDTLRGDVEDLLAGGATLEELASETDMQLATIDWTENATDDIAGYAAFQTEAAKATVEDFPAVTELEDGGIFALRLDEVVAPELQPLAAVRGEVEAAWRSAETAARLTARAEALLAQISPGSDMAALGLTATAETAITRGEFIPGTPRDFLETVFAMEPGTARALATPEGALIVRLDAVSAPDETSQEVQQARAALSAQAASGQAQDLFQYFVGDVQKRAGLALDQNAINAVLANFQ